MTITLKLMSQSRSLRLKGALLLMLTLLVASLLLERDGSGTPSPSGNHLNVIRGPFVQQLLNPFQLDEIHHLVKRMSYKQLASLFVSRMTLDEEIGQLFMVQNSHSTYSTDLEQTIEQFHVGGVILYQWQMETFDQTSHDITEMQKHATFPLLISTDEEGGTTDRLSNIYPPRPGATEISENGDAS